MGSSQLATRGTRAANGQAAGLPSVGLLSQFVGVCQSERMNEPQLRMSFEAARELPVGDDDLADQLQKAADFAMRWPTVDFGDSCLFLRAAGRVFRSHGFCTGCERCSTDGQGLSADRKKGRAAGTHHLAAFMCVFYVKIASFAPRRHQNDVMTLAPARFQAQHRPDKVCGEGRTGGLVLTLQATAARS